MPYKTEILSLFGQLEVVVAEKMMQEGKGVGKLAPTNVVSLDDIPESTKYNNRGEKVRMVVVMPSNLIDEFNSRIDNLRR